MHPAKTLLSFLKEGSCISADQLKRSGGTQEELNLTWEAFFVDLEEGRWAMMQVET